VCGAGRGACASARGRGDVRRGRVAARRVLEVAVLPRRAERRRHPARRRAGAEAEREADLVARVCPGRKPPKRAVKRPACPYKSPIQNGFS
jgi:hypothetical protein